MRAGGECEGQSFNVGSWEGQIVRVMDVRAAVLAKRDVVTGRVAGGSHWEVGQSLDGRTDCGVGANQ